jgi:hypothetical protein
MAFAPAAAQPDLTVWQKVLRYFVTNLAAILPAAVATIVFVVARFILVLPTDCTTKPVLLGAAPSSVSILGNPVFCGPDELIIAAFDAAWRRPGAMSELRPLSAQIQPDTTQTATRIGDEVGIFKEAQARLLWLGSFGSKFAVCIAAIFGLLWILAVQIEDYCLDKERNRQGWSVTGLAALLTFTALCVVAIYLGMFYGLRSFMFAGLREPVLTGSWFHAFHDAVLDFVTDRLLPAGHRLIGFSDMLVTAATVVIGLTVTMTLYQHPTQAVRRATTDIDPPYEEFLIRCFQRLTVCIYTGAALLAVCIAEIGARYSWPAALIGQPGTTIPAGLDQDYKNLADAFSQLASQFALGYGLMFTLFLAALFFPAWIILRRRAWQLVRTVQIPNNPDPSPADQEKWLTDHKMSFTTYQQFGQFIAILAPAGVGSLAALLKLLGGG